MSFKQIQIRCKGTNSFPLDSLQNFQGNLKELRESEYKKLRKSIEKYGFRFPIFVWGNFILDGHQRIFTLKKMVSEGWSIDPIPVIEIEAENEKEAKRLVLLISSRYGQGGNGKKFHGWFVFRVRPGRLWKPCRSNGYREKPEGDRKNSKERTENCF